MRNKNKFYTVGRIFIKLCIYLLQQDGLHTPEQQGPLPQSLAELHSGAVINEQDGLHLPEQHSPLPQSLAEPHSGPGTNSSIMSCWN